MTTMTGKTLTIDVFSDVVCPWCFIGKHRLDAALATLHGASPETVPQVRWLPFFLNPDTPDEGEPYREFMEKKFGGPERVKQMRDNISQAGRSAGVEFDFDKMAVRPNTLRVHRLIYRVQKTRDAGALKERVMVGHFQRGENVGDIETLVKIAVECGVDFGDTREEPGSGTRAFLNSEEDAQEVRALAQRAHEMGIGGVPFFIYNQTIGMSGAHPSEDILQAIAQAQALPPPVPPV